MKLNPIQYLDIDSQFTDFETSAVALLPFPYEGGVSYGIGTAKAPDAVLDASSQLELYDEVIDAEPYRMGITTIDTPVIPADPSAMLDVLYNETKSLIEKGKFTVVIGGDHSISSGYFKALSEHYGKMSCIQLDAHSDLRDQYMGSKFSHASVMSRIREMSPHTLQLGIRSMEAVEAKIVKENNIQCISMHKIRYEGFDLEKALAELPDPVFITLDVDVFDWSVIRSTGTPEPGGFLWHEIMEILYSIFKYKKVVGFDIVELSLQNDDINSVFAVAKLIYKMLGFKLKNYLDKNNLTWPDKPEGPLFTR